jgi:phosphate starvation-inducible protein PhoH and related proteins
MKNKVDKSPHVHQRDKIKNKVELKPLNWTPKQRKFIELATNKDSRIIFISGPAGTSKTILAVFAALELVNQRKVSDIIYIRSAVESSDSKLGYLPGEVDDKMAYYGIPLMDKLEELLNQADIQNLKKEERFHVQPVNFIRGQSWNARCALVDEAQNMTQKEIFTILTRIGKFSKCFVMADEMQSDINGKSGGFTRLCQHFTDAEGNKHGIFHFEFDEDDIMRDELTKFLVKRYKLIPETKNLHHNH